ncbi:MAG: M15 family metallopeptidase [Anaerolineales bacterium]|nr:M15 family metallopeptidase [Anaerolineales bacterium]
MSAARHPTRQPMNSGVIRWVFFIVVGLVLLGLMLRATARTVALAQAAAAQVTLMSPTPVVVVVVPATPAPPTTTSTATITPIPATPTNTPTNTPLPAATQTALYEQNCSLYSKIPADLLTVVDRDTALPADYVPADLEVAPLETRNIQYRAIPLRKPVIQPLLDMLDAMNQAGLAPLVMSGYRDITEQQLAYDKWLKLHPERAADISAIPGHSEHQLGTAVDFSSAYMIQFYGGDDGFNVRFADQPEGRWLARQAAYYGFTLSYPAYAVDQTGYAYEPWHFRYVGILALELQQRNITLTQYLHECVPAPTATPSSQ